jgi:murein L,D-transpeptidase YafK
MAFGPFRASAFGRLAAIGFLLAALAGCTGSEAPKAMRPVPAALVARMGQLDMKETSQVFIRIFKETSELEVWKERRNGTFALLKTYQICKWSGQLGPKKVEGDRQAPEGFYTVTPAQMNPNSSYYLSFNIGYPNAYDRSLGRTGSNLMVHGACSSAGCYSMTDEDAGELFALARDSFRGGQRDFQIQALPFRMTAENLARHRDDPNMSFWKMLKEGSDNFDLTLKPPKIDVCDRRYVFNADAGSVAFSASAPCPAYTVPEALTAALAKKQAADDAAVLAAIATQEARAKADAEAAQLAEAKAAERERLAAERAAQPSVVARVLGRFGLGGGAPAGAANGSAVDEQQVASVPSAAGVNDRIVVNVPLPRLRPTTARAAVAVAPVTPAVAPATPAVATPAAVEVPQPSVGTFVKRKFLWSTEGEDPASPSG